MDTPQQTTTTTTILKRKRTKRHRPTTNATHSELSTTTTEDEDTANCLILLSKGHNLISHIDKCPDSSFKFNSKRYIQTPTDDPIGFTRTYVYECKTCCRTFPSFQALGGHRASHTKPKIFQSEKPKPYTPAFSHDPSPSPSPSPQQLNHIVSLPRNTKKLSYKLHECSTCGAEFNSGQALGGHMRRHRAATATNTVLSLIPYGVVDDHDDQKSMGDDGLCLDLDLNLLAPAEATGHVSDQDQRRESSFKFTVNRNKQQPSVKISAAPTLVDCYY